MQWRIYFFILFCFFSLYLLSAVLVHTFFFKQQQKSTFSYLPFISSKLGGVWHYTDYLSSGLCKKVASEFGENHATGSQAWLTSPQVTLVLFGLPPEFSVLCFCFIYISVSLAQVAVSFISGINTFNFKKSSLVPKTSLIANKNGLGPQPSRYIFLLEIVFPADLHRYKMAEKAGVNILNVLTSIVMLSIIQNLGVCVKS